MQQKNVLVMFILLRKQKVKACASEKTFLKYQNISFSNHLQNTSKTFSFSALWLYRYNQVPIILMFCAVSIVISIVILVLVKHSKTQINLEIIRKNHLYFSKSNNVMTIFQKPIEYFPDISHMQLAIGTDVKNAYENKVHIQMTSSQSTIILLGTTKHHQEQIRKNFPFCDQSELLTKRLDAA